MTITLQAVNELIQSLESSGELSFREQKFLKLAKAFKQLAAENIGLKAAFSQKEIPSEAVDAFMEIAVMDHDWNETSEWSWVENETEVIHAVLDALKPETPATDAYLAGIKADGVRELLAALENHETFWAIREMELGSLSPEAAMVRDVGLRAIEKAKQLREGASE